MKNRIGGMIFTVLTLILALVGLIAYLVNTNTSFFSAQGVNGTVVACAIIGIVALVLWLVAGGRNMVLDIMPVIAPALFMVAGLVLLNVRVNGIASIMTFTNNAQNMQDLASAIVGIAGLVLAAVFGMINSFIDIRRAA